MQARSTAPGWRSVARQNPRAGALRLTVRCQIVGVTRCASPNSCGKSSSQSADCRSPVTNSSRDLPRRGNKKNPAQIRQQIHAEHAAQPLAATKQARRVTTVSCQIALLWRPFNSFVAADWRHYKKRKHLAQIRQSIHAEHADGPNCGQACCSISAIPSRDQTRWPWSGSRTEPSACS